MTGKDDKPILESDRQFAEQAKALFDESVDGLDAASQSKLNQARQAAVAELGSDAVRFGRWHQWVPATGVAAAAAVAVFMWNAGGKPDAVPQIPGSDFEILINDDSFEMLEDLEFYSWIDIDANIDAPTDENVS